MSRALTAATTLERLKKEAKRWLKALRAHDGPARARLLRALPGAPADPGLREIHHALALEHGFAGWTALKQALDDSAAIRAAASAADRLSLPHYEQLAEALLEAYRTGAPAAMQRVWEAAGHRRNWQAMRTYIQLDLGKRPDSEGQDVEISLDEARFIVARAYGFESWRSLAAYVAALPKAKATIAAKPVMLVSVDEAGTEQIVSRSRDWDHVIGVMKEQRIPGLNADGEMTDALLERISRLDHVTSLNLAGSTRLTDDGLRYLARLPRLQHLILGGQQITDRGLVVLRELRRLRTVSLSSTSVTDAGVANLSSCDDLERVVLAWTRTGDGAIEALAGKPRLRHFHAGHHVTASGVAMLREFPVFKTWQGGDVRMALTSPEASPNFLALPLKASFMSQALANLAGLDGLFGLSLDCESTLTPQALSPLAGLLHLGWLGCGGGKIDDDAMEPIAALPRLQFLMCQDTVAGDEGFVALSRSPSIEGIWGRRCYNLRTRGFGALAAMPRLRALSVSCKNVDDEGLSALPRFPALTELMPMDVPDEGYRHVGRCERLESLVLMYCRETTDAATEQIAGLSRLTSYHASYTRITDRSMEILAGMPSLERVSFYGCPGVTNLGVAALARLPRLREVDISGPNITREGLAVFPADVRVQYPDVG